MKTAATVSRNTKPGIERSIEIACKRLSWKALKVLEKALDDERVDMKIRLQAAQEVFNRGWGRAKQSVETIVNVHANDALLEAITHARRRTEEASRLPEPTKTEIEKDIVTH